MRAAIVLNAAAAVATSVGPSSGSGGALTSRPSASAAAARVRTGTVSRRTAQSVSSAAAAVISTKATGRSASATGAAAASASSRSATPRPAAACRRSAARRVGRRAQTNSRGRSDGPASARVACSTRNCRCSRGRDRQQGAAGGVSSSRTLTPRRLSISADHGRAGRRRRQRHRPIDAHRPHRDVAQLRQPLHIDPVEARGWSGPPPAPAPSRPSSTSAVRAAEAARPQPHVGLTRAPPRRRAHSRRRARS